MTLPVANLVQDALEVVYSAFADDKTAVGTRQGVEKLNGLARNLNALYPVIEVTAAADAGVSEFITAQADLSVGSVFSLLNAVEPADGAFVAAKGGAVAIGDVYVLDGADSVEYLGNGTLSAFDFNGETRGDFVSIGS